MYTESISSKVAQKLQIKPGSKWTVINAPTDYFPILEPLPAHVQLQFETAEHNDGIQLFVTNSKELSDQLKTLYPILQSQTILWITYPKKSSGITSDLQMMGDWEITRQYGLEIVTAVSINETWTALRFKYTSLIKPAETRNDAISKNEFADYIDVENKLIILPEYIREVLEQNQAAFAFYDSLSYSNKKEYVLWILTAKQEKTKQERLALLINKFLAGKKNPGSK